MNYLVFDIGTGNSKVAIVSSSGKIVGMKTTGNRYCRDEGYPDAQYFVPMEWEAGLLGLAETVLSEHPDLRIDGISASGARQSIVLYDADGVAFLGLPNIDNRGREWMGEIEGKQEIYEHTGKWVTEDFVAAKLMGYGKRYPEGSAKIAGITSLSEWIGEIFCGKVAIEPSQACETQLFDITKMEWSREICAKYGIDPRILPDLQAAGTKLGTIKKAMAERFSLDPDVPFVVGGADTQLAAKSSHCEEGEIVVVSGTTSPIVRVNEQRYCDHAQRCWTDCNLGGNGFLIETNPGVTGLNYQRFKDQFLADREYEELEQCYEGKTRFPCTASFSSLLFSRQKSLKVGGFMMRSPLGPDCDITDLAWALLADTAFSIYEQYLSLCDMLPFDKPYIRCCGGGFRSRTLCRLLADLTGKELILAGEFSQASILGCADVCNDFFGLSRDTGESSIVYRPKHDEGLEACHRDWSRNRLALNP
jgi:autoinducer 2 (AI-2) kinase